MGMSVLIVDRLSTRNIALRTVSSAIDVKPASGVSMNGCDLNASVRFQVKLLNVRNAQDSRLF